MLVLAVALGVTIKTDFVGALSVIAIALLFSLGFVALSKIVALITQNEDVAIFVTNFLALPLLFVSTAFHSETLFPVWMQTVSAFNSATDGVEAVRTLMLDGWIWAERWPSIISLLVFDLVFGVIAMLLVTSSPALEGGASYKGSLA